ncbi:hypothetical protein DL93DRAFT_2090698 [Clavulina sp. PMI_390]|nr:hypothetical protein DL93DRAFT_2090698 [Clavulina sp. PMI_390]
MSSSPATPSKAEKPTETSLGTPKSSIVPSSPPPASPKPAASSESTASSSDRPKAKPTNVFSDDGSFLERFQRLKKARALGPLVGYEI